MTKSSSQKNREKREALAEELRDAKKLAAEKATLAAEREKEIAELRKQLAGPASVSPESRLFRSLWPLAESGSGESSTLLSLCLSGHSLSFYPLLLVYISREEIAFPSGSGIILPRHWPLSPTVARVYSAAIKCWCRF